MNTPTNKKRRKVIENVLTVSTSAFVASQLWVSPVVEKVVLPAHAQTTNVQTNDVPTDIDPLVCSSQSIPEKIIACSDDSNSQFSVTPYLVQADGQCFSLVRGNDFLTDDAEAVGIPNHIFLVTRKSANPNQLNVAVMTFDENGVLIGGLGCCFQGACPDILDTSSVFANTVPDTGGTVRSVAYTLRYSSAPSIGTTGMVTVV
ncbi:MAG: hypothetical protein DHS20C01_00010 [marine bacterium B5-7]|nr:MAG: hypothetical protein DHS20C01_00010 [marine bacterium B5-7]